MARTEYCVRHERDAYALLARHGLATVEVVLDRADCDNPLGRPFLLTRAVPGTSLTTLLSDADARRFSALLEASGDALGRMHAISFTHPGYIVGDGPGAPPEPGQWQHPCWTARQMEADALDRLARERTRLSPQTARRLHDRFSSLATTLAPAFHPPRFVHGDCHAHQFHLALRAGRWQVTGVLDMEVASAGDSGADLVKFALEMAAFFPPATRWWQPFFRGYGGEPDFEGLRLRLLACDEASFTCFGERGWPGSREMVLARLLAAENWAELFTTHAER